MKIIKFKKVSLDKYKVYLDNGDIISLYEDVIVNNRLLLTKEVDEELIKVLNKENNSVNAYYFAIKYLTIRKRSKKEVIEYLRKKDITEEMIEKVIERLEKEGNINDFSFSKSYVNDSLLLTNKGPLRIKNELIKYGISTDIINEALYDIDYELLKEKLFNLIDKQIKIRKDSPSVLKLKLLNYFYNLGYEKEMILDELKKFNVKANIEQLQKEYNKLYRKYSKKYEESELDYYINKKLYEKGYSSEDISKIKKEI